MENREIAPSEGNFIRDVTHTAQLMSEQARMTPAEFLAKYQEETKQAFPGSLAEAMATGATPVLICARNEEKNIGALLYGLSRSTVSVQPIVVDNGSTDQTAKIARSMGAEVISESTAGLPNALRKGFSYLEENEYRGPILHTDADSVPLRTWAETMVNFGETQFTDGGHAFGYIVHYDGLHKAPKNALLTAGTAVKNLIAKIKNNPRVHVRNGIVITGNDDRLLTSLSSLPEPTETMTTDGAIRLADQIAEKPVATCKDVKALVLTSGRRQETVRAALKATFSPRKYNGMTYVERNDHRNGIT